MQSGTSSLGLLNALTSSPEIDWQLKVDCSQRVGASEGSRSSMAIAMFIHRERHYDERVLDPAHLDS